MPGVITAVAPALGALGSVGTILSSFLGPKSQDPERAPEAPKPVAAPEAPEVSSAEDVSSGAPQVDSEASRVRASKRRKASESKRLFSLDKEEDESVTLTKTLLGS